MNQRVVWLMNENVMQITPPIKQNLLTPPHTQNETKPNNKRV